MKAKLDIGPLYRGMSQQPAWRTQSGKVKRAVNMRLDPLEGARKRNPTDIHAELGINGNLEPYITSMRQFIIFIYDYQATGRGIYVLDRDTGSTIPVDAPDGWSYLNGASIGEIDTTSAIDTMMVLNRTKIPLVDTTPNYSVTGTVLAFSELPESASVGSFYKVEITENNDTPGYYLKVDPNNPVAPNGFSLIDLVGSWLKVPAPRDKNASYRQTTMPHRLVYNSTTNRFTFSKAEWRDRKTGTEQSNKTMPWADIGIQCIAFHNSGRLFLIGKNGTITAGASAPNQSIFNLFVENIGNVLDSDRVATDVYLANIGRPLRCLGVGNDLFISCENGQMVFTSADQALTGTNGNYRQVSDFRSQDVPLASNGNEIVLVDQFGAVQLFAWRDNIVGVQYQGSLMDEVPTLLKGETVKRLFYINSTIFVTTASANVYVHERFALGGEIVQMAWGKYTFYERTVYMDAWKENLYLVQKGAFHCVLRYQHHKNTSDSDDFQARLDRRQTTTLTTGYDAQTDRTAVTFLNRNPTLTNAFLRTSTGVIMSPVAVDGTTAFFPGNLVGINCTWGFGIEAEIELTKIHPQSDVRPTLSRIVIGHKDSSNYSVTVVAQGRTARTQSWNAPALNIYELGEKALDTGISKWAAQGDARYTDVIITCDGPGTMTISFVQYQIQTGSN